jgi:ankyrin repeat protein
MFLLSSFRNKEEWTRMEPHYRKMAQDLRRAHGNLLRVEYLSHWPDFGINFVFERGTVYSGKRTGQHDIHFLTLGYVGEGPRYARAFLDELGFPLSIEEIEDIRMGAIIQLRDGRVAVDYPGDPNKQNAAREAAFGRQVLQIIRDGQSEAIEALLARKAIGPDFSYDGDTLLCIAVESNQRGIVQKLLREGADVNAKGASGGHATALWAAAGKGYVEIAKDLLSAGARFDLGHSPLWNAAYRGKLELVGLLIEAGEDVNRRDSETALHAAASFKPQIIKRLIQAGANVNAQDSGGYTPLHRAVEQGEQNIEAVRLLLSAGADPTISNMHGKTALNMTKDENVRVVLQEATPSSNKLSSNVPERHAQESESVHPSPIAKKKRDWFRLWG